MRVEVEFQDQFHRWHHYQYQESPGALRDLFRMLQAVGAVFEFGC